MRASLLVAIGASIGASARWGLGELVDRSPGEFPWATLTANLVGCALAGLSMRMIGRDSPWWPVAVTGVLGGLTTFSAFSAETRGLLDAGRVGPAIVYVAASVIGGVAALEIGRWGDFA